MFTLVTCIWGALISPYEWFATLIYLVNYWKATYPFPMLQAQIITKQRIKTR